MNIKIVSDGTRAGTVVLNADTGEKLNNVVSAEWTIDAREKRSVCVLKLKDVPVELTTEATAK